MSDRPLHPQPAPQRRRWVARRIWRAFPELDDYTDKECVAFIRAARRGWLRRLVWLVLLLLIPLSALLGGVAAMGLYFGIVGAPSESSGGSSDSTTVVLALSSMLVGVAAGAGLCMMVRDWVLQQWIRHVLGTRGRCGQCGYSFVGLVIPESCRLQCPECGMEGQVDASLTVLARPGAHRPRIVTHERSVFWTPQRVGSWLRRTCITLTALVVIVGITMIVLEFRIQSQAAQARNEMPTMGQITALIQDLRPGARLTTQPRIQRCVQDLAAELEQYAEAGRAARSPRPNLNEGFPMVLPTPASQRDLETMDHWHAGTGTAERDAALSALEQAERAGLWDRLQTELAGPCEVRDPLLPPEQLAKASLTYVPGARMLARGLCARARQAIARRDTATAERSLGMAEQLARHIGEQPSQMEQLVCWAIQAVADATAQRWLMSQPTAEELDAIERTCKSLEVRGDPTLCYRYEDLSTRAMLAEQFRDPSFVRGTVYLEMPIIRLFKPASAAKLRLGTWQENSDYLTTQLEVVLANTRQEPALAEDWEGSSTDTDSDELPLMAEAVGWKPVPAHLLRGWPAQRATVTSTMLALERWRLKHGRYPERLTDLVPQLLPAVPVDVWSGFPLGYRMQDASKDPYTRPYVLYSHGVGRQPDDGPPAPLRGMPHGADDVFGDHNAILNRGNPIPR